MDFSLPLFTIILQVCTGVTCETRHLPMVEFTSKVSCDLHSQMAAANWKRTHPEWLVKRVTCYPHGQEPRQREQRV